MKRYPLNETLDLFVNNHNYLVEVTGYKHKEISYLSEESYNEFTHIDIYDENGSKVTYLHPDYDDIMTEVLDHDFEIDYAEYEENFTGHLEDEFDCWD